MLDLLKAVILGIVEGVTEFLPISSTGHLIVAAELLDFRPELRGTFEIFIQFGAVVAVILYYRAQLMQRLSGAVANEPSARRFWLALFIAFLPFAAIGFLFGDEIKEILFKPVVVAVALIVGGIILLIVERMGVARKATETDESVVSLRQAGIIGIAQLAALVPGTSRSASTIVGGLLSGLDRRTATEFSFYLAIPTLGIGTLYDLFKSLDTLQAEDLVYLLVGAVVAGVVAWFAIGWLLRYVSRNSFTAFGYYRILAGVVILVLVAAGLV